MSELTQFLSDCWRMFTDVEVPGIGITFAQLYLGVFVVGLSIAILRPLLGIGGGFINLISGAGKSAKRGYDRAYNKSYAKYRRDRDRAASFAERYKKEHK